jgi:hypothetical protein
MTRSIDVVLDAIVAISTLAAAALFFISSRIEVRDSQDHFIEDLQKIGEWNSCGAMAASIAALALFVLWVKPLITG